MPFEQSIELIDGETVLAECGPMRLAIQAWKDHRPQPELGRQAAEESFAYLEAVAKHKTLLSDFAGNIKTLPENDLAQRMIESVRAIGDIDLTPMAAVAGTIADAAATAIANACFVKDSRIVQIPAEQIDPNTDLTGVNVTVEVGVLSRSKMVQAVQTTLLKADTLCRRKLIDGALIALEDVFVMTQSMEKFISPSNQGNLA